LMEGNMRNTCLIALVAGLAFGCTGSRPKITSEDQLTPAQLETLKALRRVNDGTSTVQKEIAGLGGPEKAAARVADCLKITAGDKKPGVLLIDGMRVLGNCGLAGLRELAGFSRGYVWQTRWQALEAMAIHPYVEAIRRPDEKTRKTAIEIALRAALNALNDGNLTVRDTAAMVLGNTRDPRAVDPLIKRLDGRCPAVASALGKIGDRRATQPLLRELKTRDRNYRLFLIWDLGKLGDPAAIPALQRIADTSKDGDLAADAAKAIAQIRKTQRKRARPPGGPLWTEVTGVRPGAKHVVIDAGTNRGVKHGDMFVIKRKNEYIGKVRVTNPWPTISGADIVEQKKPIKEGDDAVAEKKPGKDD